MPKISLNKEDYGIKIENDNLYHGDIVSNDTYKLVEPEYEHKEVPTVKYKYTYIEWFLFGILTGILGFNVISFFSLKVCNFIMSLDFSIEEILSVISSDLKVTLVFVFGLSFCMSGFRAFLRMVNRMKL